MKSRLLGCRNRMWATFVLAGVLACSSSPVSGSAQTAGELDDHLQFLEPLMGRTWEGGFVGEDAPDLVISLRFERALAGRAVKYTREVDDLDYVSETHFYWNPDRQEVLFLTLNTRGMVGEGSASIQDGAIELLGVDRWPEGSIESRTVWRVDEDGVLSDTFFRREGGEWVRGHVQEFNAMVQPESGGG